MRGPSRWQIIKYQRCSVKSTLCFKILILNTLDSHSRASHAETIKGERSQFCPSVPSYSLPWSYRYNSLDGLKMNKNLQLEKLLQMLMFRTEMLKLNIFDIPVISNRSKECVRRWIARWYTRWDVTSKVFPTEASGYFDGLLINFLCWFVFVVSHQ